VAVFAPGAGLVAVLLRDRPLDRDRAQDRAAGGLEGDHESVALRLDDVAAVELDVLPDDLVLLAHELAGDLVAKLLGGVGETSDVTEKYGDGVAERHRDFGCCPGTAPFALRVVVHSRRRFGGTKNSSRCVDKTARFKTACDDAIF